MFATIVNILLPFLSFGLVYKTDIETSPGLSICLGKGYYNFFSTEILFCNYDNPISKYGCQIWSFLQIIIMSNVIDLCCVYWMSKEIKRQTEATKEMIGKKAYVIRKR